MNVIKNLKEKREEKKRFKELIKKMEIDIGVCNDILMEDRQSIRELEQSIQAYRQLLHQAELAGDVERQKDITYQLTSFINDAKALNSEMDRICNILDELRKSYSELTKGSKLKTKVTTDAVVRTATTLGTAGIIVLFEKAGSPIISKATRFIGK